ncbi:hypothetical protein P154DRAFT_477949 [Amniculicola lignicola CBS 123094]|uniref:Trichothecene 3-O-acetyltransferase n=1 Tax=Amniculicola lignicola CBS 123094 TaxID=1392246 RepID=A0A6A5VZE1_9PLEO|nr:hypothetical protein P154DRAFT_477949 [Amniculicola lignicola CBS 123094]
MAKFRRILLSPFDNVMPRYYAKFILALRLNPGQELEEVHKLLAEAFHITIDSMPFLAGKAFLSNPGSTNPSIARLEVRIPTPVTRGHYPTLAFQDLSQELDYDELMDAGLPQEDLDGDKFLPNAYIPNLQSGADILVVQANYLDGGVLLGLGIFHPVTDGSGLNTIMKAWAENCVRLQATPEVCSAEKIQTESFDHTLLKRLWLAEGNQESALSELQPTPEQWRWIGLTPMEPWPAESENPAVLAAPDAPETPPMATGVFYITHKSFATLKAEVVKECSDQKDLLVSANDALMALLWKAISSARFPDPKAESFVDQEAQLDTTLDGRALFSEDLPSSYPGNIILINTARMQLSDVIASTTSLGHIAGEIRKATNQITKKQIHSSFAIAQSIPDYSKATYPFATFEGAELCISSLLQIPLFELNFGECFGNGGLPESVRPPRHEFYNICRRCLVLPPRQHGGFEVLIQLVDEEMMRLRKDLLFGKYAKYTCA